MDFQSHARPVGAVNFTFGHSAGSKVTRMAPAGSVVSTRADAGSFLRRSIGDVWSVADCLRRPSLPRRIVCLRLTGITAKELDAIPDRPLR